jgi:hypothetical protein
VGEVGRPLQGQSRVGRLRPDQRARPNAPETVERRLRPNLQGDQENRSGAHDRDRGALELHHPGQPGPAGLDQRDLLNAHLRHCALVGERRGEGESFVCIISLERQFQCPADFFKNSLHLKCRI